MTGLTFVWTDTKSDKKVNIETTNICCYIYAVSRVCDYRLNTTRQSFDHSFYTWKKGGLLRLFFKTQ
jgi:hypothetical protein